MVLTAPKFGKKIKKEEDIKAIKKQDQSYFNQKLAEKLSKWLSKHIKIPTKNHTKAQKSVQKIMKSTKIFKL